MPWLLLVILLLALPARADVQPDGKGNYNESFAYWRVADETPLNGRTRPDPGAAVVVRFPRGYVLQGRGLERDKRGLPWLLVEYGQAGQTCYVRANSNHVYPAYLEPVRPNSQGEYTGRLEHFFWQVVDPDPAGLNGRLHPQFPPDYMSISSRWPQGDVSKWPVVCVFPPGTILKSVMGNGGMLTLQDSDKKTWIMVSDHTGLICFVRSHQGFIRPVAGPVLSP